MGKDNNLTYRFLRKSFYIILKILYGLKIQGIENIPNEGPIIFAGNHKHAFDPTLVISSTNRTVHFIAKASVLRFFPKTIIKKMNVIKIYKGKSNPVAINEAKRVLNNGGAIGIFPEGTRNRTEEELLNFRKGAVRIAQKTNATIIPFAIRGRYNIFRRNLEIEFNKPIEVEKLEIDEANNSLKEKVLEVLRK